MDVVDALYRLGGVASHRALVGATSRGSVRAAHAAGRIERTARGLYALEGHDRDVTVARGLSGVLSHASAARHRGWPTWSQPIEVSVTVPRSRHVRAQVRGAAGTPAVRIHRQDVEIDGDATSALQTVLDCARRLPFVEALAIADSALRCGEVTAQELRDAVDRLPRPGGARAVARHADGLADNPFESVVRAQALEVPGVDLRSQVQVVGYGRADLADVDLRLVVECDSFGFHAARAALLRDIERYNRAGLQRATVLRFGWEHARDGVYVRQVLSEWAHLQRLRVTGPLPTTDRNHTDTPFSV